MSWEVMEQPHELRYHCPQCPWTVTAPALDPIADEAIVAHEASHDPVHVARWAGSHIAQRHMWDLTPRRVRDGWGDAAAASAVLAGGLMLVALLGGWF